MAAKKTAVAAIPNKEETDKLITSIAKAGAKLDADIQRAGLGALAQLADHRNTGLVNRLFLSLPKGARKQAMTSWLLAFGAVVANAGDNKKEQPFVFAADKQTNVTAAMAAPWFDFSPDPAPDVVFDVAGALAALIRKAGKNSAGVNNPELLAQLRELAPTT